MGSGARTSVVLVVGVVVALAAPHLVAGPSIAADDWVWVRNGEVFGWWDAGGSRQVGRPGAFALYAVQFGLAGARPLVHQLVLLGAWALAAVAVLGALRSFVGARTALLVVVVWLVAPNHVALELWASTAQAWLAVALLAFGAHQLAAATRAGRGRWLGFLLLAAAGSFYEVAILAAAVIVVAVDVCLGAWRRSTLGWAAAVALPAAAWALGTATVYSSAVPTTEDQWVVHLGGAVGLGLADERTAIAALVVLAWLLCLVPTVRRRLRGEPAVLDRLAVVGVALVVAGVLPALRSYDVPVGMGDRLTAVSSVGAAMTWVAVAAPAAERLAPGVRRVVVAVAVALAVAVRVPAWDAWISLGDEAADASDDLAEELRASGERVVVVEGPVATDGPWQGLGDGWNTTAAVQVQSSRDDVVVEVVIDCFVTGPRREEPLEQYGDRPSPRVPGCVPDG